MSHNQVQSFSRGPFGWPSDRQPAHRANFIPQNCSRSGDLLHSSLTLDRLKEKSRGQRMCGRDLVREGGPQLLSADTLTAHACAASTNQSPSGSGCGKLAGRPGTSWKQLHGLGRNSAQQWQRPDLPQLRNRCRVNKRKGTTGFLSQETSSLRPVCSEAIAWPTGTGSGGGVPHPLLTVRLDSLAPTRASLPDSGI